MTYAITIEHVRKVLPADVFGRRPVLVEDVNLRVKEGEIHGLVGANGAGKSTTLRLLIGAARPTGGVITIHGGPTTAAASRRHVGFAPDVASLPPTLSASEILQLHRALLADTSVADVDAVLREVELFDRRHDPVRRFSKGMQQRLSLAIALLGSPKLLILDEPMSGLDPTGRDLVRSIIRMRHAAGTTILFSSHVLSDVAELCSAVTVLNKGRTVFAGPLEALAGDALGHRVVLGLRGEGGWTGPGDATLRDDRLLVTVTTDADLVAALELATSRALPILSVETLRPRLEDQLLRLLAPDSTRPAT